MRILHLNAGNLYGGIETFLRTVAQLRHLCPEMKPEFGLCFQGRHSKELEESGVPVHDLGAVRLSRPWTTWLARRRLRKLLNTTHYDAVVVHGNWLHVVFAPEIRKHPTRLVFIAHGPNDPSSRLARLAAKTVPDKLIANSRYTASCWQGQYKNIDVEIIHYPHDFTREKCDSATRQHVRTEMQTPVDKVVILQASRMEAWKGHREHIAALSQIRDLPNWEAWLAGGGQRPEEVQYCDSLRQQSQQAGLQDRIRFLGQRSDVALLMNAADIYCQPNIGPEPFGLAYVEALNAGLAVITSNFGGVVDIVDESCGILLAPGDIPEIAQALRRLVSNATERKNLAQRGPALVLQLCDPARQLRRLMEAFRPAECPV